MYIGYLEMELFVDKDTVRVLLYVIDRIKKKQTAQGTILFY